MAERRAAAWLGMAAMLLAGGHASAVGPDDFAAHCQRLAATAQVQVVFEDRPVSRNERLNIAELKRLSGGAGHPYHVLGITYAEPQARLTMQVESLTDVDGRVCAAPSVLLRVGFSEFTVYLARDVGSACRRQVVDEHEQEHVAAWRDHYRAGARLVEARLRDSLRGPIYFAHQAERQMLLRPHIDGLVAPLLEQLREGVNARQRQIDSPASYLRSEQRLRSCP